MKNFSSKGIRFSGDSIKSCVGFIDLVDSTKNTIRMDNLEYIRKYYSTFIYANALHLQDFFEHYKPRVNPFIHAETSHSFHRTRFIQHFCVHFYSSTCRSAPGQTSR